MLMYFPLKFAIDIFDHFPKSCIMSLSSRYFWLEFVDTTITRVNELPYNFGNFKKHLPHLEEVRNIIKDGELKYE